MVVIHVVSSLVNCLAGLAMLDALDAIVYRLNYVVVLSTSHCQFCKNLSLCCCWTMT